MNNIQKIEISDNIATKELYDIIKQWCVIHQSILESIWYSDTNMHFVRVKRNISQSKTNFYFRQSGDSLNFCLKSVIVRLQNKPQEID